jgi:SPP1 family predicted phage head-tail adaptor
MLTSGELDRRITIKRSSGELDDYGAPTGATTTVLDNIPAKKRNLSLREATIAGSDRSSQMLTFIIRYTNLVREQDVIEYSGETYKIRGIEEIGRKDATLMRAEIFR